MQISVIELSSDSIFKVILLQFMALYSSNLQKIVLEVIAEEESLLIIFSAMQQVLVPQLRTSQLTSIPECWVKIQVSTQQNKIKADCMIGIIITPLALYQENNGWPNELPCTWWVGLGKFKDFQRNKIASVWLEADSFAELKILHYDSFIQND